MKSNKVLIELFILGHSTGQLGIKEEKERRNVRQYLSNISTCMNLKYSLIMKKLKISLARIYCPQLRGTKEMKRKIARETDESF